MSQHVFVMPIVYLYLAICVTQSHAHELLPLLLHLTSHASPPSVHALAIRILAHVLPLLNSEDDEDDDESPNAVSLKSAFAALEPVWRTALMGADQVRKLRVFEPLFICIKTIETKIPV